MLRRALFAGLAIAVLLLPAPPSQAFYNLSGGNPLAVNRVLSEAVGLNHRGQHAEAATLLETAIAGNGEHADLLSLLGFSQRKAGRPDAAFAAYGRALALAPWHRPATEYLGELLAESGDVEGARAQLDRLAELCGGTTCAEYRTLEAFLADY